MVVVVLCLLVTILTLTIVCTSISFSSGDMKYYKSTYRKLVSGSFVHCGDDEYTSYDQFIKGGTDGYNSEDRIIIFRKGGSIKLSGTRYGNEHLFLEFPNPYAWYWGYKIHRWFKEYKKYRNVNTVLDASNNDTLQNILDIMVDISDLGYDVILEKVYYNKKHKILSKFKVNRYYKESIGVKVDIGIVGDDYPKTKETIISCFSRLKRMHPDYKVSVCAVNSYFYMVIS